MGIAAIAWVQAAVCDASPTMARLVMPEVAPKRTEAPSRPKMPRMSRAQTWAAIANKADAVGPVFALGSSRAGGDLFWGGPDLRGRRS